jgi:hypothetical protein
MYAIWNDPSFTWNSSLIAWDGFIFTTPPPPPPPEEQRAGGIRYDWQMLERLRAELAAEQLAIILADDEEVMVTCLI